MEERILVKKLQRGDKSAFDELYLYYAKPLFRTICLMMGNKSDAEDIVQDTFVKVFLHASELKNADGFRSWLYQIATRTAWNYGKKKNREIADEEIAVKMDDKTADKFFYGDTQSQMDIEQNLILQEKREQLWDVVNSLEKKQKTVVVLYYYNEFSTAQIAEITGTFEGTVKSRLFAARKNLKKKLNQSENQIYVKGDMEYGKV